METIRLVVVDFVGGETSSFISDLNEYYAQLPEKRGRKTSRKASIQGLLDRWETFASIQFDDQSLLWVFGAPLYPDDPEKQNQLAEILVEGALGIIFVVANDPVTWADSARVIRQFLDYAPVPYIVLVQGQVPKEIDSPQLRQGLGMEENTPVFGYKSVLRSTLDEVLQAILKRIISAMDRR